MTELVRGTVADRPWGMTFGALGMRGLTGQLTLVQPDGKKYCVAFEHGAIVGASSPFPGDSVARVAVLHHFATSLQVSDINRRIAAAPDRDEVDILAEMNSLSPDKAHWLRRNLIAQRAARTFSVDAGEFVVDDTATIPTRRECALDARTVVYMGTFKFLRPDRLDDDLRPYGHSFVVRASAIDDLPQFGFAPADQPLVDALVQGATLPELEAKYRDPDPKTLRSIVYALLSCNACEAIAPVPAPVAVPQVPDETPGFTLEPSPEPDHTPGFSLDASPDPAAPAPAPAPASADLDLELELAAPEPAPPPPIVGRTTRQVGPPASSGSDGGLAINFRPTRNLPSPAPPDEPRRTTTPGDLYAHATPGRPDARTATITGHPVPDARTAATAEPAPPRTATTSGPMPTRTPQPPRTATTSSSPVLPRTATPTPTPPRTATTSSSPVLPRTATPPPTPPRTATTSTSPVQPRTATTSASPVPPRTATTSASPVPPRTATTSASPVPPRTATTSAPVPSRTATPLPATPRTSTTGQPYARTMTAPVNARTVTPSATAKGTDPSVVNPYDKTEPAMTARSGATSAPPINVTPASGVRVQTPPVGVPMMSGGTGEVPGQTPSSGVRVTTPPSGVRASTPTGGIAGLAGAGNDHSGLRPGESGPIPTLDSGEFEQRATSDEAALAEEAFTRGSSALRREDLAEAIEHLSRATTLNPQSIDYLAVLAWARFIAATDKEGIADDTRKTLARAINKSKTPDVAYFYLGRVERMLGRDREALRYFREVVELKPRHADAKAEIRMIEARLQSAAAREKSGLFGTRKR